MNQLAKIDQSTGLSAMTETEVMKVLQSSVYPGAADESIRMVMSYCEAAKLDPLQKPVHIVPMDVAVKQSDGSTEYVKRDVIMPGIGLYRVQAARSGSYAGMTEPTFGPTKTIMGQKKQYNNANRNDRSFKMVDDGKITYPEWCKITVKRLLDGKMVEFTAFEYWLENYATAGKDTTSPNAMWKKRPFAQLAKCAEAQALRKAFPEVGSAPTAEEMEGKNFIEEIDITPAKTVEQPTAKVEQKPADKEAPAKAANAPEGPPAKGMATDGEKNFIKKKLEALNIKLEDAMEGSGITDFDNLTPDGFIAMREYISEHSK